MIGTSRPRAAPSPPGRVGTRLRVLGAVTGTGARAGARRARAGAAVRWGAAVFLGATVALAAAVETVRPEWRDPEYGFRLRAAERLCRAHPGRPLVLVVGSSRAQMGVSPADMGLPDEPGAPLVANFGYRAATPVGAYLQVRRAEADGLRPRAVLLLLALNELNTAAPPEVQMADRAAGLSGRDLAALGPFAGRAAGLRRELWAARRNPWAARGSELASDLAPGLLDGPGRARAREWLEMDRYGFVPFPAAGTDPAHRAGLVAAARALGPALNAPAPGPACERAVRELAAWGRARGAAVAAAWAPESPAFRELYGPEGHRGRARAERLFAELGVPLFPAPDHLAEAAFVDGYHLTRAGAAEYSLWLAAAHLRHWPPPAE